MLGRADARSFGPKTSEVAPAPAVEVVERKGKPLALILRQGTGAPGVHFLTPPEFSQQLAYMRHRAGKKIEPHTHNLVAREIFYTQEVLFLRKGKLRVDLYDDHRVYLESRILGSGDIILLAAGGHGFSVLEEIEMIEVKQGPYCGDQDKTRFEGIEDQGVTLGPCHASSR
jgi:hypothetical protein